MLSLSSEDYFLEEADSNIQANLEDAVVREALENGVDLREYSKQVENELRVVENESIRDYIKESRNIASLHKQIVECDHLLEGMEKMLMSFQSDLSSISSEILSLQHQSVGMNVKLKNRQAVRGEMTQFVDEMIIPEDMVMVILNTPVHETIFLEQLQNLENKIDFIKEQYFRDARSCHDVKDIVDNLKLKAVSKIREFLLERINLFKRPLTNYQVPQNTILKFKFYYKFLMANNREVATEIKEKYVDIMSKVMWSYHTEYSTRLMKLQHDHPPGPEDLMGSLDEPINHTKGLASVFSRSSGPSLPNKKASVFSMGDRADILSNAPLILIPHALERNRTQCFYEVLFRSEQFTLMENACRECLFLHEFFAAPRLQNGDKDNTVLFHLVYGKILRTIEKSVADHVNTSHDAIALFLCVHLVSGFRRTCLETGVGALEGYWGALRSLLMSRLQDIVRRNVWSLRDAELRKFNTLQDTRPHYVTRRYAEFSAAFIAVNENNPPVTADLKELLQEMLQEMEAFILKIASNFTSRKDQLIFLINNFDVLLSVLSDKTSGESRESHVFKTHFEARCEEYTEEVLRPHFGELIGYVNRIEEGTTRRRTNEEILRVVSNFNSGWQASLDSIHKEVLGAFPNFKNGTAILQRTLTRFVSYYHRFHKALSREETTGGQLISVHQLMVEVKKYKSNF